MKKIVLATLFLSAFLFQESFAASSDFGFFGGLSTPSNKINDVYNSKTIQINDTAIGNLVSRGLDNGYYLGVKFSFPLNNNFTFYASLAYNSFPQSEIKVVDPNNPDKILTYYFSTSTKNCSNFSRVVSFIHFIQQLAHILSGNLAYSYIYSTVDQKVFRS